MPQFSISVRSPYRKLCRDRRGQTDEAIATGIGISSWFVPTSSDERKGGTIECSFGPRMDSVDKVAEWDPPRRFITGTVESPESVASEWTVEARSGGTCVVRVVHRWFADSGDWDAEFEAHAHGWAISYFRLLRLEQPGPGLAYD